jgi:hypothetical protein
MCAPQVIAVKHQDIAALMAELRARQAAMDGRMRELAERLGGAGGGGGAAARAPPRGPPPEQQG